MNYICKQNFISNLFDIEDELNISCLSAMQVKQIIDFFTNLQFK